MSPSLRRDLIAGASAGLIGGLAFAWAMQAQGLRAAAGLAGLPSTGTGAALKVLAAILIGAGYGAIFRYQPFAYAPTISSGVLYGLLFRRQSYDVGSALGWGLSYGFFWWILGPLTLQPLLLGTAPRWTAEVAAGLFPSLIGHLAFGAGLGVVFHLLEARHNPWWVPRSRMEPARVTRRKEQVLTSAPALSTLVVAIALVLPIILGM